MAKVFFDTNFFIDFIEQRQQFDLQQLEAHLLLVSPLSIHILSYLYKYRMPEKKLENIHKIFTIIPLDQLIAVNSLNGPTSDFEDNVQLHSAAQVEADVFLTNDDKLLKLKFFGKVEIKESFIT